MSKFSADQGNKKKKSSNRLMATISDIFSTQDMDDSASLQSNLKSRHGRKHGARSIGANTVCSSSTFCTYIALLTSSAFVVIVMQVILLLLMQCTIFDHFHTCRVFQSPNTFALLRNCATLHPEAKAFVRYENGG